MRNIVQRLSVGAFLLLMTAQAMAFGGCVDSPENPTLVLGAVGGAVASLPWLKAHWRAWVASRRDIG